MRSVGRCARGGLTRHKRTIILTVPPPNAGPWGDAWLSFSSAYADARLGVSIYTNGSWGGVQPRNVPDNGDRLGEKLPPAPARSSLAG